MPKKLFGEIALNYLYKQDSASKSIVMLHGYGASSYVWSELFESYSGDYSLLAFDQRGWGDSDKPSGQEYSVNDYVKDVARVSSVLTNRKFVLAGSSMGGMIAQVFCLEHPEQVQALVLVGTRAKARSDIKDQVRGIRERGFEWLIRETASRSFSESADSLIVGRLEAEGMKTTKDCALHTLEAFAGLDLRDRLHEIKAPTLIVFGNEDRITPVIEGRDLNNGISDSRLVILDGAGHLPMLEAYEQFNLELAEFLRKIK